MEFYKNIFIKYLIRNFNNYLGRDLYFRILYKKSITEYLEFVDSNEDYKKFSNEQSGSMCKIEIFDMLDNNGMNKLIRSLYKLNDKKYKVKNNFRKPPKFKNLRYTQMQINHTGSGILAEIILKENEFISTINLAYTQINNQEFVICYAFWLNKMINSHERSSSFIRNNIKNTFKGQYQSVYNMKQIIKGGMEEILKIEESFFRDIFQSYIVNNLYTKFGIKYKLPILFYNQFSSELEVELRTPFLSKSFFNKKDKCYLWINMWKDEPSLDVFYFTDVIPDIDFISYFQYLGNEFYYYIFEHIECAELNSRIGKYLNFKKKYVTQGDCHWVIDKIKTIGDSKLRYTPYIIEHIEKMNDDWENYENGEKTNKKFLKYPEYLTRYEAIYKEHLVYFNNLFSVQNNTLVLRVAKRTFYFTIIGILLTCISIWVTYLTSQH
ncbi:hypothetical protein SDC9_05970 [bioreactor metagenome]|uniref:Uncharacterized protein n=1 Tax=bioreactor metagenome TaxID=1076179 RepID=A0A644T0U3_9ZZZZ|nr:hypothetical protein [Negativicutes bacterium]